MSARDERLDPRVVRTHAAAREAARILFLRQGYVGTTMDQIAVQAGLTKRTLYNNYADKAALFVEIVEEVTTYAERFAAELRAERSDGVTRATVRKSIEELGRRLALGIVREETVMLRRMLIGEARAFPEMGRSYFDRAPGQVLAALASHFAALGRRGLLKVPDPRRAAAQFAYLIAGQTLDRAILTGITPSTRVITECAREGVETFLARYGKGSALG